MSAAPIANVFDSWSETHVRILFNPWYITNWWGLLLSCTGLFVGAGMLAVLVWCKAMTIRQRERQERTDEERARLLAGGTYPDHLSVPRPEQRSLVCWYLGYLSLSLITHVFGAFIGMALMSFNPWVFVSIVFGYTIGDALTVGKRV